MWFIQWAHLRTIEYSLVCSPLMRTFIVPILGLCLTYENQSAMKREDTKWQAERDVWWQVLLNENLLLYTVVILYFKARAYLLWITLLNCYNLLHNIFQDVVTKFPTKCDVEWVDAEDTLFLLYTSGSTGKPKVLLSSNWAVFSSYCISWIFISLVVCRVCCILLGATWCTLQQPLSTHLTTSQLTYLVGGST